MRYPLEYPVKIDLLSTICDSALRRQRRQKANVEDAL
jgi:hypothetical protein